MMGPNVIIQDLYDLGTVNGPWLVPQVNCTWEDLRVNAAGSKTDLTIWEGLWSLIAQCQVYLGQRVQYSEELGGWKV